MLVFSFGHQQVWEVRAGCTVAHQHFIWSYRWNGDVGERNPREIRGKRVAD
jgi:hypothetical protein